MPAYVCKHPRVHVSPSNTCVSHTQARSDVANGHTAKAHCEVLPGSGTPLTVTRQRLTASASASWQAGHEAAPAAASGQARHEPAPASVWW